MELEAEESLIQAESSDGLNLNSSDFVAHVRKLLFRWMLVGIRDGRFFLGTFHCMDKQGNIILQDAVEYRSTWRSSTSPMDGGALVLFSFLPPVVRLVMWVVLLKCNCLC